MMRLGVDLGGTKLLAALVDDEGRLVRTAHRPTGAETGPARVLDLVADALAELDAPVRGIGLGFPGLVDGERGRVRSSIMLDGWADVPLAARLGERFGVPCAVDNDVNAHALAEQRWRADVHSMVFVAVGTGVGGALVLGGRLWRGVAGLAGEIGNTTVDFRAGPRDWAGRRGTLNAFAAGRSLDAAPEAWRPAAEALGVGLGNVVNVLNPALVVIGGGFARFGPPLLVHVRAGMASIAFPEAAAACRLELARAGYEAGAIGAALLVD
jgi:glucokinase